MTEPDTVPLREHVEAILDEQRRGMIVAEQEREKAARALGAALLVAEQEREKAAQALAAALAKQIDAGDEALRDHIGQQVHQINAALAAIQREMELTSEYQQTAIAKAETATEKRFESVNEFRAQLASQTDSFLPREVAESQFAELRRSITDLTAKMSKLV